MRFWAFDGSVKFWVTALAFIAFLLPGLATAQQNSNAYELRILDYNIKMLPRSLPLRHKPLARARLIPEQVAADSAQIIVFEEAFDRKAVKIIREKLKAVYPYRMGPLNGKRPSIKLSGGVMIFSKMPLKLLGEVTFRHCEKEDCFARKGALLVEAEWQGRTFQVMGTHMQSGGSADLMQEQYGEIERLMNQYRRDSVVQFYCGDFNTSRNTALYDTMMQCFKAEDGPFAEGLPYTSDHMLSDMYKYSTGHRSVKDYVLCRLNNAAQATITREVRRYEGCWAKNHCDLSDHFAVLMKMRW